MYIQYPYEIWRNHQIFDIITNFTQVKSMYEMMMRTTTKMLYTDKDLWNKRINSLQFIIEYIPHDMISVSTSPNLSISYNFETRCICKWCDIMIIIPVLGRRTLREAMPRIPLGKLHASSVQHPMYPSFRWPVRPAESIDKVVKETLRCRAEEYPRVADLQRTGRSCKACPRARVSDVETVALRWRGLEDSKVWMCSECLTCAITLSCQDRRRQTLEPPKAPSLSWH